MAREKKRLVIIDSNAVIHRAFHALPFLTTKTGEAVNAIYGFLLVFFKAVREFKPDFIIATFDFPAPSFRQEKYKLYKANRQKAPAELYEQIPKVKEILEYFNVQVFEKKGFEADDIIGALASRATKLPSSLPASATLKALQAGLPASATPKALQADNFQFPKKENLETIIITGDLDLLQLVNKRTKVYLLRKGVKDAVLYDKEKVEERYQGVEPEQLPDFKGLRGDPSDNIPGVFGVGEKTAIFLIKKFGTLENLYKELKTGSEKSKGIKESLRKKLLNYKEQAFISKMLAEIRFDVPIDFDLKKCRWGRYDKEKVKRIFEKYQFQTLINRLP